MQFIRFPAPTSNWNNFFITAVQKLSLIKCISLQKQNKKTNEKHTLKLTFIIRTTIQPPPMNPKNPYIPLRT